MPPTDQHIESLIKACQQNDQTAQMEVYNRYCKAMYNIAFRIVKNGFEAEDIMQDSFLTAFTKLNTLKDVKMFGAWLKKIVVNNSIGHYKAKMKQQEIPLENVLYKIEDEPQYNVEDENLATKAKQVLKKMNELKDNYRLALTLHLIEGYDYEEISSIMEISNANCRTTISRAKESLRKKLQPMTA
ncbi:MAG TPA: RNA polymerase sigma factor [Flavobacteriaceae bacterium]|nr:RNA polymerase sigma factor [Flavobacteriaceae bacterium]